MSSSLTLWGIAIVVATIVGLVGRTATAAPTPHGKGHRALVVGTAAGIVYDAIAHHYKVTSGTGDEDPSDYDLVVFDGHNTTPDALQSNPAPANFLAAGKAVVILNNTEDHRRVGLGHLLWAHAQGSSPAVAFFIPRDHRGVPRFVVQIDFPVGLNGNGASTGPRPSAHNPRPSPHQMRDATQHWLATLQSRMNSANASANIPAPVSGSGQTALTIDDVVSGVGNIPNAWTSSEELKNEVILGDAEFCSGLNLSDCPSSPTGAVAAPSVDVENMLSVLLEPTSSGYQHKIIARQYSLMSPQILSPQSFMKCLDGNGVCSVPSLLGFNAASTLKLLPSFGGAPLTVTEVMPQTINNTTTLTTSESHSETVGLSATAGYSSGSPGGSLSGNWSETWEWSQSTSINIQDWSSSNSVSNPNVTYQFEATGGTNVTYSNLVSHEFPAYCSECMSTSANSLNALQQSGMVSQSETEWVSNGGPIPPGQYTLTAAALLYFGEAYYFWEITGPTAFPPTGEYGNLTVAGPTQQPPGTSFSSIFALDFTNPTLMPPAAAPWTLSFGPYSTSSSGPGYVQTTGTLVLNSPSATDTQINLTYVVQPQQSLQTLPSEEACPGNTSSFIPGNAVVDFGSPPLTITVPAGQTQTTFTLTLQTFNSSTYNLQVVAWQPTGNLQAASCLTPPNTLP